MGQDRVAPEADGCPRCSSTSALPRRAGLASVVLLGVLILVLAGCGSGRLSAQQAAHKIGQYLPRYHVQCHPTPGPFWDYACTVTPPPGSGDKPYKMKVTVGPHEILDKAVCGARTGTSLNC